MIDRKNELEENFREIRNRITRACNDSGRSPDEVHLIAVSKTYPESDIEHAITLGQRSFGENKIQDLATKMEYFADIKDLEWHMIGTLQTNKVKYIAERVHWIHSVSKIKALDEIEKRAKPFNRIINVLIQVNISDEDQKSGCDPEELPSLIQHAESLNHVKVRGLMGMATFVDNPELVRPEFRLLKSLLEQERSKPYKKAELNHLSMGMTNDLEVAIQEGATMVRIGTAIFGKRDYS